MITIEIEGAEELQRRFRKYPTRYHQALDKTLDATLLTIQGEIPAYPRYDSTYVRTGTLGRTLGSNMSGGAAGQADIHTKTIGPQMFEAKFGTRLKYAQYVIGEQTQAKSMGHWWTLDGTVYRSVEPKIKRLFELMVQKLANWLDGLEN